MKLLSNFQNLINARKWFRAHATRPNFFFSKDSDGHFVEVIIISICHPSRFVKEKRRSNSYLIEFDDVKYANHAIKIVHSCSFFFVSSSCYKNLSTKSISHWKPIWMVQMASNWSLLSDFWMGRQIVVQVLLIQAKALPYRNAGKTSTRHATCNTTQTFCFCCLNHPPNLKKMTDAQHPILSGLDNKQSRVLPHPHVVYYSCYSKKKNAFKNGLLLDVLWMCIHFFSEFQKKKLSFSCTSLETIW